MVQCPKYPMDDVAGGSREEISASGGGLPSKPLPNNRCLNCGRDPLDTPYCPDCGQENSDRPAPLRAMLADVLEEFLKWDGRLFHTLRLLLFKPGELTRSYNEGRRIRYISPFKMYFVVSALFFTLVTTQMAPEVMKVNLVDGNKDNKVKFVSREYTKGSIQQQYVAEQKDPKNKKPDKGFEYFVKRGVAGLLDSPGNFFNNLLQSMAKALVVLLPVYAGLLGVLYWRHKRYFVEHLVFAAHVQTFVFILLSVIDLLLKVTPFAPILILIYPFYEFKALRACYGSEFFPTWIKQAFLGFIYFLALNIALAVTAVTTLVTG